MKQAFMRTAAVILALGVMSTVLFAQQSGLAQSAQSAYEKKAYAEGGPLFLLAASAEPGAASSHLYNAACCYALAGQKDLAFYALGVAVKRGWKNRQHTERDDDLASLRSDPRWKEILDAIPLPSKLSLNRDAMINDLNNLSAQAYQYRIRPTSVGGGQGSYKNFTIPVKMATNANGTYETIAVQPDLLRIRGTSAEGNGTIEASINQDGRLLDWKYSGKFAEPVKEVQAAPTKASNRDALINQMNNIAAFCYQYRIRPTSVGGGAGAYTGIKLPESLAASEDGSFSLLDVEADRLKIEAVSKKVTGKIISALDYEGRLSSWTYFGEFQ
jgi:hypothetical protein